MFSDKISASTVQTARAGRIIGSEMRQKACTAPAPSTRAASYRSSGTDCSAARITIAERGVSLPPPQPRIRRVRQPPLEAEPHVIPADEVGGVQGAVHDAEGRVVDP